MSNCYKFIVQAREVYEQYLQSLKEIDDNDEEEEQEDEEEETKNFEDIPEPLLEVPIDLKSVEKSTILTKESPLAAAENALTVNEIKTEPMTVEGTLNVEESMQNNNLTSDNDIKEEKPEYIDYNTSNTPCTVEIVGKSIEELPKEPLIDATTNDDDR